MRTRWLVVVLAAVAVGVPARAQAQAEAQAEAQAQCAAPAGVYRETVGWAQKLVDPSRIWPLTDGSGQLLAVVGTGVDAANAQFGTGQVVSTPDSSGDCDGRGTFAAGIVAARADSATTFVGIAPGARILAIRYTQATTGSGGDGPDPDALATAITAAVGGGASVVLVAVPALRSSPELATAVARALSRGVVVVSPAVGSEQGQRSYPAALPGVVAVGALDRAGAPVQTESGDHLSLAAPGADLVSTSAGADGEVGHRWGITDPSFSAAYVAGTVALLRGYRPALTPAQVLDRLTATASRPPGGARDDRLGWGTLNAYAAVAAELPASAAAPPTGVQLAPEPARPQGDSRPAGAIAILGVALAALLAVALVLVRGGRARNWRP